MSGSGEPPRGTRGGAARALRLALVVALPLAGCSPIDLEQSPTASPGLPPVLLRTVAVEGWSGAVRELSLEAQQASIDLEKRLARLEQVRISLAGHEQGPLEIRAPEGEFDLSRDALRLAGGVEGWTRPDERFTTAALRYDQETGRLHSSDPVRLERPNLLLTAASMDLDLGARRLSLRGSVRAELQPE